MLMKFFKKQSRGSLALVLILTSTIGTYGHAQASESWPNEPDGWRAVVDCNFNTVTCGQLTDNYNSGRVATNATAPFSPTSVLEQVKGPSCGGCGAWLYKTLSYPSEMYLGFWWKMNSDFWGSGNLGNKLFFIKTDQVPSFFTLYGSPGSSSFQLRHNMQNSFGINNCHLAGAVNPCSAGTMWLNMNIDPGAASASKEVWYRIEIYAKRSTSSTSQDGKLKVWKDGTLLGDWSTVNWGDSGFRSFDLLHTWDGSPSVVDSHTWIHWFDHVYISTPSGGSSDTTPPRAPTGLAFQ